MVTAYLDGSLLYGSTPEANAQIRLFQGGLMKFQEINGGIYPPGVHDAKSVCRVSKNEDLCIQAGTHCFSFRISINYLDTHPQNNYCYNSG